MGKNKRLAINIISQVFSFCVNLGVSFVLTPYITAKLGKDVYGFVGMAYQVTSYISVFTVAFNAMLSVFVATKYYQKDFEKANEYFSSIAIIDIALAIVLVLPLMIIVVYMDMILNVPANSVIDIKILWMIIFISFLLNLALGPYSVGLYIKNRLDICARRSLESNFIKGSILLLCFLLLLPKVWYIGFATFVSSLFLLLFNVVYLNKYTPELKIRKEKFKWSAVKELLSIGIWNTISQLTNILVSGLDLIVSNLFIGSLAMGYISYAQTVPIQMGNLIATISNSFGPQLNKSYAVGNMDEFVSDINSAIKVCGFLCSVPILGFIVFGRSFYSLWLPSLTNEEVNMINILSFLILFHTIFDVYLYPLYTVHSITKNIKMPMIVSFAASILNILFELALLKTTNLGVYAIEIATALLMALRVIVFTPIYSAFILEQKWYVFYKPLIRGVLSSAIIVVAYIGIYSFVNINSWLALVVVAIFAGVLGYLINYFVVLQRKERMQVKNMFLKKIKFNR